MTWELRYYKDLRGREPCREWIDELIRNRRQTAKGLAALAALDRVLAQHGIDVCESEWGRNLGAGLYEFRVRHTKPEIDRMFDEAGVEGSPDPSRRLPRTWDHPRLGSSVVRSDREPP